MAGSVPVSRSDAADDRWEYRTIRPPRGATKKEAEDPTEEMNDLAADGWRLVETISYTGGGTKYLVFERPARAADDADQS